MVSSTVNKFLNIFFPYSHERQQLIESKGTRFVHYTNADAAMNILRTHEVWMRESSCMNDYREVQHGIDCIISAYKSEKLGREFQAALNELFPGITLEIEQLFDGWLPSLRTDTYLTCVSEHRDDEDEHGRLSMWRAYCGSTGVAIVMNSGAFFDGPGLLKAVTSPVAYLSDKQLEEELGRIAVNIRKEADFIKAQNRDAVRSIVFQMLRFAAVSTKHPAFREELEWRIIHCPSLEPSPYLLKDVQAINGVPQTIYKVPLKNLPDVGITGGELHELVNRIIIGPTQYPLALYKAFVQLLRDAKVPDPESKVHVSQIPLRR